MHVLLTFVLRVCSVLGARFQGPRFGGKWREAPSFGTLFFVNLGRIHSNWFVGPSTACSGPWCTLLLLLHFVCGAFRGILFGRNVDLCHRCEYLHQYSNPALSQLSILRPTLPCVYIKLHITMKRPRERERM